MTTKQRPNFDVAVRLKPFCSTSYLEGRDGPNNTHKLEPANVFKARNLIKSVINGEYPQIYPISVPNQREEEYNAIELVGQTLQIIEDEFDSMSSREQAYHFNKIFDPTASNEYVFKEVVAPKLDIALEENSSLTIMAYGATRTGKTHTIFGKNCQSTSDKGICNCAIERLLNRIKSTKDTRKYDLKCSYYEIYNEQIIDLLAEFDRSLQVLDDFQKGNDSVIQGCLHYTL